MKHRFLLDENILYFAVLGVDEHGSPDSASIELASRIGANCHRIVIDAFLIDRYHRHLLLIGREHRRGNANEPISYIRELLKKAEKLQWRQEDYPELPAGVMIPAKDVEIVRLALLYQAVIVTCDEPLTAALGKAAGLGLRVLRPVEALELAADT